MTWCWSWLESASATCLKCGAACLGQQKKLLHVGQTVTCLPDSGVGCVIGIQDLEDFTEWLCVKSCPCAMQRISECSITKTHWKCTAQSAARWDRSSPLAALNSSCGFCFISLQNFLPWSCLTESVMKTVWRPSVRLSVPSAHLPWLARGSIACDSASVHFGPTVRRTDTIFLLCDAICNAFV